MTTERFVGAHVSAAGGFEKALEIAKKLGVNTIQIHPSPPQKWNSKPFPAGVEDKFLAARAASGVKKVFFHGIYLVNMATPDAGKFELAKLSLIHDLDLAARLNADGLIFHVGSNKDQPDPATGFARAAAGINDVLARSKNSARLILEVAAGSGSVIGAKLEELRAIYDLVEDKSRVGFGLDSQHMWASGFDLQNDMDPIIARIEKVLGLDKVWSVHLNDSMTELASRKDRHENFGEGLIGEEALTRFLNHPKLREIPFILETPALKDLETAAAECTKVLAAVR